MTCERPARFLVAAFIAAVLCPALYAQTDEGAPAAPSPPTALHPLDSYGYVTWEDQQARLDNFAIELQNNPAARGYIIVYGGRKDFPAVAQRWAEVYANYLTATRGLDGSRVRALSGGLKDQDDMEFELWVVPPGLHAPKPEPTFSDEGRKAPTGKFAEYETDEQSFYGCEEGPCIDRAGINLAGWLGRVPTLRAFLVVYTAKESTPGAAGMIGKREQRSLLQTGKLDADRLKVIHAGEAEKTKVELWLLADGEPPPAAEAKAAPLPPGPFKLGELDSYGLADADNAAWVREGVADLLRENAGARVQLIVHPPDQQASDAEAAESAADGESGGGKTERVEPRRAAEDWRKELVARYGIDERRVEVVEGRVEEWSAGSLAAWVVPEGAPPPDPFAMPDDFADNQGAEEPPETTARPPGGRR